MEKDFLLDRTTYKKIKSFDRKQMEQFIKDIIDNAADVKYNLNVKDAAGNIEEVGSATLGDNKSIELNGGVLSVKDFGKRFYKYVAATETEAAKYELVEVSESNPWKAGLQPRVDAEGNIGWYEPNPTTIEGVQDQVTGIQGDVEQAQQDIDAVEENLVKAEEKIDSINDTLYGTEGEEAVKGLVEKVAENAQAVVDEATAREAFRLASHKLPVRTKFIKKENGGE